MTWPPSLQFSISLAFFADADGSLLLFRLRVGPELSYEIICVFFNSLHLHLPWYAFYTTHAQR